MNDEPSVLPQLLDPETAAAFVTLMWRDIREQRTTIQHHNQGLLRRNAIEVHGRNQPLMLGLHWGLTPLIAEKVGMDLLPSFAYYRIYFQNDVCRVHADRMACEVSLSLTLTYSDGLPWDLCVGSWHDFDADLITDDFGEEPFSKFTTRPGEGVLYSGRSRRHGRVAPNPNRWSAHLFLQWVDRVGPYRNEAFERLELD